MLPMLKTRTAFPDLLNEFFGRDFSPRFIDYERNWSMPSVNVIENKESFKIEVAAPGLEKNDFKVDVHNHLLTISSEKEEKQEENNEKFVRREFNYASFKRSFSLPESVDTEKIQATHKDGILLVEIPKKEEAKEKPMRQIQIS